MGILDFILGRDQWHRMVVDQLQKDLLVFGLHPSEALQAAEKSCALAKKLSRTAGSDKLPVNFGDVLTGRSPPADAATQLAAAQLRPHVERIRGLGVTAVDIQEYWNSPAFVRIAFEIEDNARRLTIFKMYRHDGLSPEEAGAEGKLHHVVYGSGPGGQQNSPSVPWELRRRVTAHLLRRIDANPLELERDVAAHGTMNAYVWATLKSGGL